VALSCPFSFAAECGAMMYGRPAAELAASEVRDAWGELVNIVGGNLKALLTPPCRLGLPSVEDAATYSYREPHSRVLNQLTFACRSPGSASASCAATASGWPRAARAPLPPARPG